MTPTGRGVAGVIVALALTSCASVAVIESPPAPSAGSTPGLGMAQAALHAARIERGALGAIAVVRDGDETWRIVSGTADAAGSPVSGDTRFRIGSITKPIVAALALDQLHQGSLSLDTDIAGVIGAPLRTTPPVSLRTLLDHTSGVFDIGNEGDVIADIEKLTDEALVEEAEALIAAAGEGLQVVASDRLAIGLAETHDRYFPPGVGYHYSNANYQIIGLALREVTGRPIEDLLHSRVATPLGLSHTTLAPADRTTPDLHGYVSDTRTGEEIDVTDDLLAFGNGASGGIISTADELLTIMTEIVHGSLLSEELRVAMQTPTPQSGGTYGLGLARYELSCGRFYGHEGRVNGTVSIALVAASRPDHALVAAFNSTDDRNSLIDFGEQLLCRRSTAAAAPPHPSGG